MRRWNKRRLLGVEKALPEDNSIFRKRSGFVTYVRLIRPAMIVAADKVAKFDAQKVNTAAREEQKRLVAIFRENNKKKEK